ncbi:syndecan-4-like [Gastrophryne carolinensis]
MKLVLLVLCAFLAAASAESIRETETMDPKGMFYNVKEASGSLPDDEDLNDPDYYDEMDSDSDSDDDGSGSGDSDETDDLESTSDTPTFELGNEILDNDVEREDDDNLLEENEVIPKKLIPNEVDLSNKISMASTDNSIFSKTEVVIALGAGAVVGLLFAAFIITLLVVRYRRNKMDLNYDTVKKPIYKKAPTVEA